MNRTLRLVLIIAGVFIVLLLVAPFLIPVNQFKPAIEEKASEAMGRKVQVGNLSLSLLGGSLGADNLSIADDEKFSPAPFLTAKSVKVGVEILPLIFSRSLKVTTVTIDSPQVSLIRGPGAQWNYSSLSSGAAQAKSAPPAQGTSTPEVSVQKLELKNGRVSISSTGSAKVTIYDNVSVTASNVSLTTQFPVKVSADLPGGGKFKMDGTIGPMDATDAVLTPVNAKLTMSDFNLASTGFLDPKAGLSGMLDLDANVVSQSGQSEVAGTAKLSKALLMAGGSPAAVPLTMDFHTTYNLAKNSGVLEPSDVKIGSATANLSGTYEVPPGSEAVVNIKVNGQNMPAKDLVAFMPALGINMPQGASLQTGTINTSMNLTGPTNKLVTAGNAGVYNAKLVGFDMGSKMSAASSLLGVKTGKDLDIEKMTTDVRMDPAGLKANNFDAVLPAFGTLTGGGTIDTQNTLAFKVVVTLKSMGMESSNCKGLSVPVQIEGTTANPKFVPDVGAAAGSLVKSQVGCAGNALKSVSGDAGKSLGKVGGLFKKKQ